jgi:hypothetical protein
MAGLLGGSRRHLDSPAIIAVRAMGLLPNLHPIADHFRVVAMNDRRVPVPNQPRQQAATLNGIREDSPTSNKKSGQP